jgi:hypothetical protein
MPSRSSDLDKYPRVLDWLRYFCAFMLYMYGTSKLLHLQFNLESELAPRAIGSLTGYQLTWYYFGYSRVYANVLGLTQVAGATLLLFRKTTLIGAVAMLPVMGNILLINIFVLVNDYGPYVIATLICASLLAILWHQRVALVTLFWSAQESESARSGHIHWWIRASIVLAVVAIMISGTVLKHRVEHQRQQAQDAQGK